MAPNGGFQHLLFRKLRKYMEASLDAMQRRFLLIAGLLFFSRNVVSVFRSYSKQKDILAYLLNLYKNRRSKQRTRIFCMDSLVLLARSSMRY